MHVLMKGDLGTREKVIVEGPRKESYHELANALNYDHHMAVHKNMIGNIIDGHFVPIKQYIWYDEKVKPH